MIHSHRFGGNGVKYEKLCIRKRFRDWLHEW
jgi:hypothetical protein